MREKYATDFRFILVRVCGNDPRQDVWAPKWGVAKHRSCQGADTVCDVRGADGDCERNDYGTGPELGWEVPGDWARRTGPEGTYTINQEREPVQVVNTVPIFIAAGTEETFVIPRVAGSSATRCRIVVSSVAGEIASATVPLNSEVGVERGSSMGQ